MKTLLKVGSVSKLDPEIVIVSPGTAIAGEKEEMVGAATDPAVVNVSSERSKPAAVSTRIAPVPAPEGTVTWSLRVVADVTVASTPLTLTVLSPGAAAKPVPWTVTVAPAGALFGVNSRIIGPVAERAIDWRLPTWS